jgi:hypothetical protein
MAHDTNKLAAEVLPANTRAICPDCATKSRLQDRLTYVPTARPYFCALVKLGHQVEGPCFGRGFVLQVVHFN